MARYATRDGSGRSASLDHARRQLLKAASPPSVDLLEQLRRHPRGLAATALALGVVAGAFPSARRLLGRALIAAAGLVVRSMTTPRSWQPRPAGLSCAHDRRL